MITDRMPLAGPRDAPAAIPAPVLQSETVRARNCLERTGKDGPREDIPTSMPRPPPPARPSSDLTLSLRLVPTRAAPQLRGLRLWCWKALMLSGLALFQRLKTLALRAIVLHSRLCRRLTVRCRTTTDPHRKRSPPAIRSAGSSTYILSSSEKYSRVPSCPGRRRRRNTAFVLSNTMSGSQEGEQGRP